MQTKIDNQKEFAVVHVRPGVVDKQHPVGTVAINLTEAKAGMLVVGYGIQHSKSDKWNAQRGSEVAVGRATKSRKQIRLVCEATRNASRRELLVWALQAVQERGELTRTFKKALADSIERMSHNV